MALIPKPLIVDILSVQPNYSGTQYAATIQLKIDEAYILYGEFIKNLPEDNQLFAFGYAVCHLFSLDCWHNQGYPAPPIVLSSRNESVKFAQGKFSSSLFTGSMCGQRLYSLLASQSNMGVFVGKKKTNCC